MKFNAQNSLFALDITHSEDIQKKLIYFFSRLQMEAVISIERVDEERERDSEKMPQGVCIYEVLVRRKVKKLKSQAEVGKEDRGCNLPHMGACLAFGPPQFKIKNGGNHACCNIHVHVVAVIKFSVGQVCNMKDKKRKNEFSGPFLLEVSLCDIMLHT